MKTWVWCFNHWGGRLPELLRGQKEAAEAQEKTCETGQGERVDLGGLGGWRRALHTLYTLIFTHTWLNKVLSIVRLHTRMNTHSFKGQTVCVCEAAVSLITEQQSPFPLSLLCLCFIICLDPPIRFFFSQINVLLLLKFPLLLCSPSSFFFHVLISASSPFSFCTCLFITSPSSFPPSSFPLLSLCCFSLSQLLYLSCSFPFIISSSFDFSFFFVVFTRWIELSRVSWGALHSYVNLSSIYSHIIYILYISFFKILKQLTTKKLNSLRYN